MKQMLVLALAMILAISLLSCTRQAVVQVLSDDRITPEDRMVAVKLAGHRGYFVLANTYSGEVSCRVLVVVDDLGKEVKLKSGNADGRLEFTTSAATSAQRFIIVEAKVEVKEVLLDGTPLSELSLPPGPVVTDEENPDDWYIRFMTDKRGDVSAISIVLSGTEAPPDWEIRYASSGKTVQLSGGNPEIMRNGDVLYSGADGYLHVLSPDGTDIAYADIKPMGLWLEPSERFVAYTKHISGEWETRVAAIAVFDLQTGEDRLLYQLERNLSVAIWGWHQGQIIVDSRDLTSSHASFGLSLQLLGLDGTLTDWTEFSGLPNSELYRVMISLDSRFVAYQTATEPTSVIIINLETLELQTIEDCSEPLWAEDGITVISGGERKLVPVKGL